MRLWQYGVGFSLALGLGFGAAAGCAAGGNQPPGTGGAGATGAGGSTSTGSGGSGTITTTMDASADGFGECAKFNAEAKQAPAAMLIVLDRSASMSQLGKFGAAQLAIIQAIDKDVFDTMALGLSTFPAGFVGAPDCLCPGLGPTCFGLLPFGVACGAPTLPQVAVTVGGPEKSNAPMGVRHEIYKYLTTPTNGPETNDPSDASPIYDSLVGAYNALKASPYPADKRMVVLITDGGGSCTSLTSRTSTAYYDGACYDWENPDGMNQLIAGARNDAAKPINTFIVGVPGSNTHAGEMQGPYAVPPYSMRLALSTYAVSGSPETVDPACDKGATFSQAGPDPAVPCHIDLSNGASFNADALAKAITDIRGKALGCTYDLPTPPAGETINPGQVNVVVTIDGTDYSIPKRSDPNDMCLTDPCWDYNDKGQVELIGITCSTVSTANSAKVQIFVGCATIIK
jgi:hypothetical protein